MRKILQCQSASECIGRYMSSVVQTGKAKASLNASLAALTAAQKALMNQVFGEWC